MFEFLKFWKKKKKYATGGVVCAKRERLFGDSPSEQVRVTAAPPAYAQTSRVQTPSKTEDSSDMLTSMIVADVTGSPVLGYMAGGSLMGAIIGEELSESSHSDNSSSSDNSCSDTSDSSSSCDSSCDSSSSSDCGSSD